jgi:hypothetical protein
MDTQHTLFDRLGGIRKAADLLGKPPSTVQSWKTAGRIPSSEQPHVLQTAREAGIEITERDVIFPLGEPA